MKRPSAYAYKEPGHLDVEHSEEERLQFGRRLTKYIANNGYTQLDICRELGVGTDAVREWCLGRRIPKPNKLEALARFLGKTPAWLLTGSEPKAVAPRRLSDLPGLYIVTRKVFPPGTDLKAPKVPPLWDWTSPALAGTKAGLEKFFAHPNAMTEAKHVGAL